jgi:hypothetical protein
MPLRPPSRQEAEAPLLTEQARAAHEAKIRQPWPLQPDPIPDPLDLTGSSIAELEQIQMLTARWISYLEAEVAYAAGLSLEAKHRARRAETMDFLARPKSDGSERIRVRRAEAAPEVARLEEQYLRAHINHALLEGRLRGFIRLDDRVSRILTARFESQRR